MKLFYFKLNELKCICILFGIKLVRILLLFDLIIHNKISNRTVGQQLTINGNINGH